jgi:hypothetical protein
VHAASKPERVLEPVARSEIWKQYHAGALRDGHPEPERFADAAVRERTQTLLKKEKRSKVAFLSDPPKPPTAAQEAGSKPSARTKTAGAKCQAKTLEGRQCGFAATCGPFCKKHAPKEAPRPAKADPRRFDGSSLKGHLCIPRQLVTARLGPSHCPPNEKVDIEWFLQIDDVLVSLYYYKDDPRLHVGGHSVDAVAKARSLLMD